MDNTQKELHNRGRDVGALFCSEIDRLIEENKELFEGEDDKKFTRLALYSLSTRIIGALHDFIHLDLWDDYLSLLSNHIELMRTETLRIRREKENGQ